MTRSGFLAGLAVALLLLVPLPAAGAQEETFPGVRGRLYESPSAGIVVTWDPALWEVIKSGPMEVNGRDVDGVALKTSIGTVGIEFWRETSKGDDLGLESCIEERFATVSAKPALSDLTLVESPALQGGYPFGAGMSARWTGLVHANEDATLPIAVGITCQRGPGTDLLSTIRETRIVIMADAGSGWPTVYEGYSFRPVEAGSGPVVDIRASLAPGARPAGEAVVRVTTENLDVIPARLDVEAFVAIEEGVTSAPSGYTVVESTAPGVGPVFELGPGDRVVVDLIYPARDVMAVSLWLPQGEDSVEVMQPCCGGAGLLPLVRLSE